jgi:hypothetical protein
MRSANTSSGMHKWLTIFLLLLSTFVRAQDETASDPAPSETIATPEYVVIRRLMPAVFNGGRMLPIGSDFKDIVFAPQEKDVSLTRAFRLSDPSFFPVVNRGQYQVMTETKKRYSNFGYYLYQRELLQIKDSNAQIWITPLFELSAGVELQDTAPKRYQNTRGARLEGVIGDKLFFTTSFYENQAILPSYVSAYVSQRGEQYPNMGDSSYGTQNAVIPGAARTKPFKVNGYDYAYATGMVSWYATKRLTLHVGNQPVFVGSGHRSLLWSDNSVGMMNLRARYAFRRWDFQFVRARGLNLLRRPEATNGEAYYEPKSMSIATIHFRPTSQISIGLFEGGMWYRGDSISQKSIQPLYFLPLPGAATIQESIDNTSAYALTGIDFRAYLFDQVVYGQFALNPAKSNSLVYQAGVRIFTMEDRSLMVQLEYNHADDQAYVATLSRLNYGNYNLPVAHPAGNAFDELLLRCSWQQNHWFALLQTNYFLHQSSDATLLMPVNKTTTAYDRQVLNQYIELGYRFNRTYGLDVFAGFRYRYANDLQTYERSWISAGIRTQLNNHYFDF